MPDPAPPPPPSTSPAPSVPQPAGGGDDFVNQLMQWLTSAAGGGGGLPGGNLGGGSMVPGGLPITPDALGMGGGADPLGMGQMLAGGGFGLNPYQAAGLRLRRNNEMNMLRQNMANQHRAIGPAGGRDFSRHVENINDEILALQEQKVQDNIKNALAYNQQLMQYGQQNFAKNEKLAQQIAEAFGDFLRYGRDQSPGTFSGAPGTQAPDAQAAG